MKNILLLVYILAGTLVKAQILSSNIGFEIKNAGLVVNGILGELKGNIEFDPIALHKSKIRVSLAVSDLQTGIATRDKHLKGASYFNQEKFPEIIIESKFFGKNGSDYKGYFVLTLKGKSESVTIPFSYIEKENEYELVGTFTLNRLDYSIGEKSILMANEVRINIKVKVKKND